jgi:DNA-binding Xre family transcriptional regulator
LTLPYGPRDPTIKPLSIMLSNNDKLAQVRFGEHLKKLRLERNLSYRKMASTCSVDNSKISKIEKGRVNITLSTLLQLAEALGVHPRELLDY